MNSLLSKGLPSLLQHNNLKGSILWYLVFVMVWVVLVIKNLPVNAGDIKDRFDPGLGRYPGGENGSLVQYSCLEDSVDGGAWQAIVHRVTKSRTRLKRFNTAHTSLWFNAHISSVHDYWKNHNFGIWTFVLKVMSLPRFLICCLDLA